MPYIPNDRCEFPKHLCPIDVCGKYYHTKAELIAHVQKPHKGPTAAGYHCKSCAGRVTAQEELGKHLRGCVDDQDLFENEPVQRGWNHLGRKGWKG